jgi:hypothetical protein
MSALIYAEINNRVNNPNDMRNMINGLSNAPSTRDEISEYADKLLDQTTIKRACCIHNQQKSTSKSQAIKIRIPIPTEIDTSKLSPIATKFKFYEKVIEVPMSQCDPSWDTNFCDQFYQIYCHNIRNNYELEKESKNEKYDGSEFAQFSGECACYGKEIKDNSTVQSIPHTCYMIGCSQNQLAFLDKGSRKDDNSARDCNLTICQSTIEMGGLDAGKDIKFNSSVVQNCTGSSDKTIIKPDESKPVEPKQDEAKPVDKKEETKIDDKTEKKPEEKISEKTSEKTGMSKTVLIISIILCLIAIIVSCYYMFAK